ncbi:MAG: phenylalanine--tRNA ligase subunit alpha, partial [Candidatus Bathyarchaeota archaeon]
MDLSEKKLIQIHEQPRKIVTLNEEGEEYAVQGLPERRLIEYIIESGFKGKLEEAGKNVQLATRQIPIAVGWLHRKGWVKIESDGGVIIPSLRPREGDDENLLKQLHKRGKITVKELGVKMSHVAVNLKRRKLAEIEEKTVRTLELTKKGRNLVPQLSEWVPEEASQLTPEMIVSRKWRTTKLRKFNVVAEGPQTYPGKAHPLQQMIDRTRKIFLSMGFTEIRGPLVETAFWNFDALFQPQDHPAREMQDTFYLSTPEKGRLPSKQVVDAVSKTHENGWTTGSKGWGYHWKE